MKNHRLILLGGALLATALGADHLLRAGVQDAPVAPIVLFAQGVAAFTEERFEEARTLFTRVVDNDPRHAEGHYYLGICEAKLKRYPAALLHLEEAVACDTSFAARLRTDRYLDTECASDVTFSAGVRNIWERLERRKRGDVTGLKFEFSLQDADGKAYSGASFTGHPTAIVFLDESSGNSLDAGLIIDRLRSSEDIAFRAVGIVRARGKSIENQVNSLERYASTSGLGFPLLLSTGEVERQLRPFHRHPTVLLLDAQGQPRRIVEGHDPELEARYRAAVVETIAIGKQTRAAPTVPKEQTEPTSRPGQQ